MPGPDTPEIPKKPHEDPDWMKEIFQPQKEDPLERMRRRIERREPEREKENV